MALIGKGRTIIVEERPSAKREENPLPNPHPNPVQNRGSDGELRETVKELADLLEAQAELIQETVEEVAPKPVTSEENDSEQNAERVSDVQPLNEPQTPENPTPVKSETPPPKPPESQNPLPPQKKRNGFAGLFLGKR